MIKPVWRYLEAKISPKAKGRKGERMKLSADF